jgi:hypothetical protein
MESVRTSGNFSLQKTNNSIEDLGRNKENYYPVPDPNSDNKYVH